MRSVRGELLRGDMEENVGGCGADKQLSGSWVGRRVVASAESEAKSARLRQQLDRRRIAESARFVARECERWKRITRVIERRVTHRRHHKQLRARADLKKKYE